MVQYLMHVNRGQPAGFGRGEPQHLRHQQINALQFAPDHFSHLLVLAFFQQHIYKGADGDETVFDLVGDARGNQAEVGEAVQPLEIFRQASIRSS